MRIYVELYLMVLRGELPPQALLARAEPRLLAVCDRCAMERQADCEAGGDAADDAPLLPAPPPPTPPPLSPLPADLRRLPLDAWERRKRRLSTARRAARQARLYVDRLLSLPEAERPRRIAKGGTGYRTRAVAERLLDESRWRARNEPESAGGLAALAAAVAAAIPGAEGTPWVAGLAARAAALEANALRVAGDLPAADRAFVELRRRLAASPPLPAGAAAEIESLEASLRIDDRRLTDAEELLRKAIPLAATAGDPALQARASVQHAGLLQTLGRPEQALVQLERAASLLSAMKDRASLFGVAVNRLNALCDLERFDEAETLLAALELPPELADNPHAEAILHGARGRVLLGLGRHDEAADSYLACRDGYLALDRTYDAALASLDLAQTYLEAGRTAELKTLAAELVPQFRARGVGREALAALVLLTKAVAAEEITAALIAEARRRLDRVSG